jgi:hypothetical protein
MQAGDLDQRPDLRLGAAQQQRAASDPQTARNHRQVEHQRGVREHQFAEIDDDVSFSADRADQGLPTASLRRPVLISTAA